MDKESKRQSIKMKREGEEFVVDSSEFELIRKFISFVRGRERGVFVAEIVTHQKNRFVKLDFTDKDLIDLKPIQKDDNTERLVNNN